MMDHILTNGSPDIPPPPSEYLVGKVQDIAQSVTSVVALVKDT